MDWIDEMVEEIWSRFNSSRLKPILDNLGLKRGDKGFSIGGVLGYQSLKLYDFDAEVRQYDNGKLFVFFGYDGSAGAWGGYTRKYEVTDPAIFKSPRWMNAVKRGGVKTSPDVIMI